MVNHFCFFPIIILIRRAGLAACNFFSILLGFQIFRSNFYQIFFCCNLSRMVHPPPAPPVYPPRLWRTRKPLFYVAGLILSIDPPGFCIAPLLVASIIRYLRWYPGEFGTDFGSPPLASLCTGPLYRGILSLVFYYVELSILKISLSYSMKVVSACYSLIFRLR